MAVITEDELEHVYDELDYTAGLRSALFGTIAESALFTSDPPFFMQPPTLTDRMRQVASGMIDADADVAERDTYRARKLVGAMRKLEEIGPGELEIRGGDDAEWIKKRAEREAWVRYAVGVLYREGPDAVDTLPGSAGALQGSGPAVVVKRVGGTARVCYCLPGRCCC